MDFVDLSGLKQMTDAGGGSGLYSLALCQKYPNLHSTILDVNETLAVTAEFIANRQEKNHNWIRDKKSPLSNINIYHTHMI